MNYYGYVFVSDSDLTHHGIKGQKWGIRRFQNDDGSLTAAGVKRYASDIGSSVREKVIAKREAGYEKRAKQRITGLPSTRAERSNNIFIDSMGGRKINADYETRRKRGETLSKAGRSRIGAVGRHVGRSILVGMGASAIGGLAGAALSRNGAARVNKMLSTAVAAYEVSSIIKTYQDISDINTYKDSARK